MSSWPFGASHGQAEIIATECGGKDLRISGCHKKESRDSLFKAHLIDGILALDAGGLTRSLTFEEQENIQTIALTHRHFDHIRGLLPFGLTMRDSGVIVDVYGIKDTLDFVAEKLIGESRHALMARLK